MSCLKLNLQGNLFSKLKPCAIFASFLMLAFLEVCQSARAQNIQLQPIAGLASEPLSGSSASRPRRVTIAEGASAAVEVSVSSPSLDEANAVERSAFEKTNRARVQNGLAPLAWDAELGGMARAHSESMARLGFFSHETPDALQLRDRARSRGIRFRVIGENIAYNKGYEDPGALAVERWMMSSGHRANILYIGFQASAIGSYISADGTVYLTQVFINR